MEMKQMCLNWHPWPQTLVHESVRVRLLHDCTLEHGRLSFPFMFSRGNCQAFLQPLGQSKGVDSTPNPWEVPTEALVHQLGKRIGKAAQCPPKDR